MNFETLPGFRSFLPDKCFVRNYIFNTWRKTAHSYNFQEYDAPTLEPLDLYKEKSGDEIVNQLFNFTDRGDREVALRPEMTPSLARLVGEKANSLKRPVKWFSIGEQFRYERPQKGRLRSFYQYNVDILGEPGVGADAELIGCLVDSLCAFGLDSNDFKVRLSDRDLWVRFLKYWGVQDTAMPSVLSIMDRIEKMDTSSALEQLKNHFKEDPEPFIQSVKALFKVQSISELEAFFSSLSANGEQADGFKNRIEDLSRLFATLQSMNLDQYVFVDFKIVRGLAYYTGFVFEAFEATGKGRALAGGGRYDDLIGKLSGNPMEAVGFAMGDVTLIDLLNDKAKIPDYVPSADIAFIFSGEAESECALKDAHGFRREGFKVEYPTKEMTFSKQFKDAGQKGIRFAFIYGSDELSENKVKLKDFKTGEEVLLKRTQATMLEAIKGLL